MRGVRLSTITILAVGLLAVSAVGVVAQDGEAVAQGPVEFSGKWYFEGGQRLAGTTEPVGAAGIVREQGGAWYQTAADVTDPRFDGEVTIFSNVDGYETSGRAVYGVAWRVENADGAWQSDPAYTVDVADGSNSGLTAIFRGEDGYEGLVAVVDVELVDGGYWDIHGVILDGDLPPAPEPRRLP